MGIELIKRCNECRVIVDCSHTGYRTTMEAIEQSERPVVFSHANPRAVFESRRNIGDDQIKAIAETGGLVGAVGFPGFVSSDPQPSLEQFIDHIDYLVEVGGSTTLALVSASGILVLLASVLPAVVVFSVFATDPPRVVTRIPSWDHRRNWSEYSVDGFPGMTE